MTIGIIGGGNMGLAILTRVKKAHKVLVCEREPGRAKLLKKKYRATVVDLATLITQSKVLIVAVKPQDIELVLAEIRKNILHGQLVISIAAGITTSFLEQKLGPGIKVIRSMPNMPAQIGAGITAIAQGRWATAQDLRAATKIFSVIGEAVIVKEEQMDAVTAVSGSGPAYVFLFAECFWEAAHQLGLDQELTCQLVRATLKGSVAQMLAAEESPDQLRAKVTSKGGTTQAALEVFDHYRIRDIFKEALAAAKKRSGELARRS